MDGVPVDRTNFDFFVVQKNRLGDHGAGVYHVAVGEDDAVLGVHHETSGHLIGGHLGVEGARNPNAQHDDSRDDLLERGLPCVLMVRALGDRRASEKRRKKAPKKQRPALFLRSMSGPEGPGIANEPLCHSSKATARGSASRTFPTRPLPDLPGHGAGDRAGS